MKANTAFSLFRTQPANPLPLRRGTRSVTCFGSDGDARAPRAARPPPMIDTNRTLQPAAPRVAGGGVLSSPGATLPSPAERPRLPVHKRNQLKVHKFGVRSISPAQKSYLLE